MFEGKKKILKCTQINFGNINEVFSLLCPVRETEWLEGWTFNMIYSKSGFIEKDCVFTTTNYGKFDTVWQVTQYDKNNHCIEFLRVTPESELVKINISLKEKSHDTTQTEIEYQYTSLIENRNKYYENDLEDEFAGMMNWWEKAINHFLKTGKMLKS